MTPSLPESPDTRLVAALQEGAEKYPRIASVYRGAVSRRFIVLTCLAALHGLLDGLGHMNHDARLFGSAGIRLIFDGSLDVFSNPAIQVGPLHLVLNGLVASVAELLGVPLRLPLAIVVEVGFSLGIVTIFRTLWKDGGRPEAPGLELFIGMVAILGGLSWTAATSAHPAEGLIPLLWILSAREAVRGRPWTAGTLIGVAGGFKLWGLLGAPLLMLGRNGRATVKSGATALSVSALLYGPFLLGGSVRTFDYKWAVNPHSALSLLLEADSTFDWSMRLLQSMVIIGAGTALVLSTRSLRHALWALPLAIVSIRLLVDPLVYHYYWLPVGTLLVIGMCASLPSHPSVLRAPVAAVYFGSLWPFFYLGARPLALFILIVCLGLCAIAVKVTALSSSGTTA